MSTDYYATFAPVELDREELVPILEAVVFNGEGPSCLSADRLSLTGGRLRYEWESLEFAELSDALAATSDWDGLEIPFVRERRQWSLLLWSDVEGCSTLTLCEPGSVYERQIERESVRMNFVEMLEELRARLCASFCVLEAESVFRSRRVEEIEGWLDGLGRGENPKGWELVICEDKKISQERIPLRYRAQHDFVPVGELSSSAWIISFMGPLRP
ncbi:hypothetical protein G6O69_06095 [Pseudenhygromyxa sp. WMMC2535]|uniref:hypothetical protein n=1 Tax=Pseudenhygromyxa sp. WMMC2535 TaxID=2712867 RepID=UPI0015522EB3|nr:hypothetical protein [Pseudenhygromyxa sp. WMMC2535]NVB37395.1 hypothetical protein [Pseudenhygromyxa sp. WMMC2535]